MYDSWIGKLDMCFLCFIPSFLFALFAEMETSRRESLDESQRLLNEHLKNEASELLDFLGSGGGAQPSSVSGVGKRKVSQDSLASSAPSGKRSRSVSAPAKTGEEPSGMACCLFIFCSLFLSLH